MTVPFAGRRGPFARHILPIVVDAAVRDRVRERLAAARVQTSIHYHPVHLFTHYRRALGHRDGELPVTEGIAAGIITLPLHQKMRIRDVDLVCRELAAALRGA